MKFIELTLVRDCEEEDKEEYIKGAPILLNVSVIKEVYPNEEHAEICTVDQEAFLVHESYETIKKLIMD